MLTDILCTIAAGITLVLVLGLLIRAEAWIRRNAQQGGWLGNALGILSFILASILTFVLAGILVFISFYA